jgi:hypothetical protein
VLEAATSVDEVAPGLAVGALLEVAAIVMDDEVAAGA